jgi:hypothetical protein
VNAFTQLPTYDAADFRWQHTTFGPPWTVVAAGSGLHPNGSDNGTEEWAVRRWVSPASGAMKRRLRGGGNGEEGDVARERSDHGPAVDVTA